MLGNPIHGFRYAFLGLTGSRIYNRMVMILHDSIDSKLKMVLFAHVGLLRYVLGDRYGAPAINSYQPSI